jgi:spore coat protein A
VQVNELLIAPGERYDLVVDFSQFSDGDDVYLNNWGPDDPFPAATPANATTTGRVMKFEVRGETVGSAPAWNDGDVALRDGGTFIVPGTPAVTRQLFLFEGLDEFGRLQPLLGTAIDADGANSRNSRAWFEPITENPGLNAVEIWEVYNTTGDAHPIHLHLVSFQIVTRQDFSFALRDVPQPMASGAFGVGKDVFRFALVGGTRRAAPWEQAPKDTVVMLPDTVTRIKMQFSPPNTETSGDGTIRYVWHCHILSHEDHEMMRPYVVGDCPAEICET